MADRSPIRLTLGFERYAQLGRLRAEATRINPRHRPWACAPQHDRSSARATRILGLAGKLQKTSAEKPARG
jgi:hypothetical protein